MLYNLDYPSPLGKITVVSDGDSIIALWFEEQKHFGLDSCECADGEGVPAIISAVKWLDCYFSGGIPDFIPPLAPISPTPFRKAVLMELMKIPYGKTTTYGEIAKAVAGAMGREKMSAQAVGGAVGNNPISLIIPCHRVIGADGSLTGYDGGVWRKKALLEMEKGVSLG